MKSLIGILAMCAACAMIRPVQAQGGEVQAAIEGFKKALEVAEESREPRCASMVTLGINRDNQITAQLNTCKRLLPRDQPSCLETARGMALQMRDLILKACDRPTPSAQRSDGKAELEQSARLLNASMRRLASLAEAAQRSASPDCRSSVDYANPAYQASKATHQIIVNPQVTNVRLLILLHLQAKALADAASETIQVLCR